MCYFHSCTIITHDYAAQVIILSYLKGVRESAQYDAYSHKIAVAVISISIYIAYLTVKLKRTGN